MELLKTNFLDLDDLIINTANMKYVKNVEYSNGHWYAIDNSDKNKNLDMKYYDYRKFYERFVNLGKQLYDDYKCIKAIQYRDGIEIYNCDFLVFNKSYFKKSRKSIIKTIIRWCENNPVAIVKDRNIKNKAHHEHQDEIEIFALMDIAIFTYLVLSSFNNYLLKKSKNKKDQEDYECGNKIRFNDFMEIGEGERDKFLYIITHIINQYETKIYNIDNRPLLQERTALTYNDVSHKCNFSRTFDNIYSVFWIMLKGQLFAMSNNNEIFHICRCGNVMVSKAKHCETCLKQIDRDRK